MSEQQSPTSSNDTEHVLFAMLREMPPWRKLEMVAQLNQMVRELALAGLREQHPAASPAELQRRLADVVPGTELATRVYGPLLSEPTVQISLNEIALKVEAKAQAILLEKALSESGSQQVEREELHECHRTSSNGPVRCGCRW
jgi:hypothetical protein